MNLVIFYFPVLRILNLIVNFNYNCSSVSDLRILQEQVWKAFCSKNCINVRLNYFSDLITFRIQALNFFPTVGQKNCRNKIPSSCLMDFISVDVLIHMKNKSKVQVQVWKLLHMVSLQAIFSSRNILGLFKATTATPMALG